MGPTVRRRVRPTRIADDSGVMRDYEELLTMLDQHLCHDGLDQHRLHVGGDTQAVLNWRDQRIRDITELIGALCQVIIPFRDRRRVLAKLLCFRWQLAAIHWPDAEGDLRRQLDGLIRRLKHTTRTGRTLASVQRRLKPASQLPIPRRRT